ncbi:MAG: hypothetical protein ACKOC4_09175 [Planctomycetia bacterium]
MSTHSHRRARRASTPAKLSLEALERRRCMAGDVSADLEDGRLELDGDGQDNEILVQQIGAETFRVTGLNGTTVNGQASQVFASAGIDLDIDLKGGNDLLVIDDSADRPLVVRTLMIDLGTGSDEAEIDNLIVSEADTVEIKLGKGSENDADDLVIDDAVFAGSVKVTTGNGSDDVVVTDTFVAGDLTIDLSGGNDDVMLGGVNDRVDVARKLAILGGRGDDVATFQELHAGEVNVAFGDGASFLEGLDVQVAGSFTAKGGDRQNTFDLRTVKAQAMVLEYGKGFTVGELTTIDTRNLSVKTGGGADALAMIQVTADTFFANLGRGDDTLTANQVASDAAIIEGDRGHDTIELSFFNGGASIAPPSGRLTIRGGSGDDTVRLSLVRAAEALLDGGTNDDTLEEFLVNITHKEVKNF